MARSETILMIDDEIMRAVQTVADDAGRPASDVIEEALRRYLRGMEEFEAVVRRIQATEADSDEAETASMVYDELRALRAEREAR